MAERAPVASSGARRRARRSTTSRSPASRSRRPVAHWLGRIKAAAARVNAELGLLEPTRPSASPRRRDRIAGGELDDQFPIDVFQTGSGTSSNMNANEVIATLAGEDVHANDDVNMGQSSNDVFPSAVHLAALEEIVSELLPALDAARAVARGQGARVRRRRQVGADALDGRGAGHARPGVRAATPRRCARAAPASTRRSSGSGRSRSAGPPSARAQHASRVRGARARAARRRDRPDDRAAGRPVRVAGGARRARRGVGRAEDRRRLADEDRERPALHGLGPARRARRDLPARAPEGQLDHAREGEPGHPRSRDPGGGAGDRQRRGDRDRRHAGPLRAERVRAAAGAQPARLDQAAHERVAACSPSGASTASRRTASSASATRS